MHSQDKQGPLPEHSDPLPDDANALKENTDPLREHPDEFPDDVISFSMYEANSFPDHQNLFPAPFSFAMQLHSLSTKIYSRNTQIRSQTMPKHTKSTPIQSQNTQIHA